MLKSKVYFGPVFDKIIIVELGWNTPSERARSKLSENIEIGPSELFREPTLSTLKMQGN